MCLNKDKCNVKMEFLKFYFDRKEMRGVCEEAVPLQ